MYFLNTYVKKQIRLLFLTPIRFTKKHKCKTPLQKI